MKMITLTIKLPFLQLNQSKVREFLRLQKLNRIVAKNILEFPDIGGAWIYQIIRNAFGDNKIKPLLIKININQIVSKPIVQLTVDHKCSIRLEDLFKVWQTSNQRKPTKSAARQITHLLAVAALATANAESACGYREARVYGG